MSRYQVGSDFTHGAPAPPGVLLTNLGSPDAPTTAAVRRYLAEFLWDPRVVEIPRPLWWLILHGIVLRTRPARSAHAYQTVWTDAGAPLIDLSRKQLQAVREFLRAHARAEVAVALGMRYGNPSIAQGLEELRKAGARRVLVLPLYPQYSGATTASTFDAVAAVLKTWRWVPDVRFVSHYHDDAAYIGALAASVREYWAEHGEPERLLFSFHGMPKRTLRLGDPYFCQCQKTARLVCEKLGLEEGRAHVAFQSRFGRAEWLQPYTAQTLEEWGKKGVRSVHVVCPGFSADCLETLEEIAIGGKQIFLGAGGERFHYIPALNDRAGHVAALGEIILRNSQGWPEAGDDWDAGRAAAEAARTRDRALALGAER